jgi:hypothetical protein
VPGPGTVPGMFETLDTHLPESFALTFVRYATPRGHDERDEVLRVVITKDQVHTHRSRRSRTTRPTYPRLRSTVHRSSRTALASLTTTVAAAERAGFVPLSGIVPLTHLNDLTVHTLPESVADATQRAWTALESYNENRVAVLALNPAALVLLPPLDNGFPAPRYLVSGFGSVLSAGTGEAHTPALLRVPPTLTAALTALCPYVVWAPPTPSDHFALSLLESYAPRSLTRTRFHNTIVAAGIAA